MSRPRRTPPGMSPSARTLADRAAMVPPWTAMAGVGLLVAGGDQGQGDQDGWRRALLADQSGHPQAAREGLGLRRIAGPGPHGLVGSSRLVARWPPLVSWPAGKGTHQQQQRVDGPNPDQPGQLARQVGRSP